MRREEELKFNILQVRDYEIQNGHPVIMFTMSCWYKTRVNGRTFTHRNPGIFNY
jgi:hypothetical protein